MRQTKMVVWARIVLLVCAGCATPAAAERASEGARLQPLPRLAGWLSQPLRDWLVDPLTDSLLGGAATPLNGRIGPRLRLAGGLMQRDLGLPLGWAPVAAVESRALRRSAPAEATLHWTFNLDTGASFRRMRVAARGYAIAGIEPLRPVWEDELRFGDADEKLQPVLSLVANVRF